MQSTSPYPFLRGQGVPVRAGVGVWTAMRRLIQDRWIDGVLDAWRPPGACRVALRSFVVLADVAEARVRSTQHWRAPWNYVRRVGARQVVRKVVSRVRERVVGGPSVAGLGRGVVVEADAGGRFAVGDAVLVFVPRGGLLDERVVVEEAWLWPDELSQPVAPPEGLRWRELRGRVVLPERWAARVGWSRWSGAPLDAPDAEGWRALLQAAAGAAEGVEVRGFDVRAPSAVRTVAWGTREEFGRGRRGRKRVTLVGYGHYARTCVVPLLGDGLVLTRVHEVNAGVLGAARDPRVTWAVSPTLLDDDPCDVVVAAGFHHTHVDAALWALARGRWAIVEKPVVTTRAQLRVLRDALDGAEVSRVLAGYHRRFGEELAWAREDLRLDGAPDGPPLVYRAMVHEVALPAGHWYRWPASGTEILSNACHWIDQFLALTGWRPPLRWAARRVGAQVVVEVVLVDGSSMVLTLTSAGASRHGVRESVEIARGDRAVRIIDGESYVAEDHQRVLRVARLRREAPHAVMMQRFARMIIDDAPGEPTRALLGTSALVVALDEILARGGGEGGDDPEIEECFS